MEVDQTIEDSNDVIDAKHERIKNASAAKSEALVEVVELRKSEEDQC